MVNAALYDKDSFLEFDSEGADAGKIVDQNDKLSYPNKIKVPTILLSKYIKQRVDFLKIDIEGAELIVLNEIKSKLHLVERIFIEYHSFENNDQNLSEILQILERFEFRYYISSGGLRNNFPYIEKKTYLGMDNQLNIFAFKKK